MLPDDCNDAQACVKKPWRWFAFPFPTASAQHSRHIDRKLYKMREMRGVGRVTVKYVPTDDNTADIFTKILSRQPFEKHRRTLLNLAAMPQT